MLRTLILFLSLFTSLASASETASSPLTLTQTAPAPGQSFPLLVVGTIIIPPSLETVGEAVNHVLSGTGFKQAHLSVRSKQDILLMDRPLANVQRSFQQVPMVDILDAIVGIGFEPVIDPINYVVAFDISGDFISGK
jgi:hypothetical protein